MATMIGPRYWIAAGKAVLLANVQSPAFGVEVGIVQPVVFVPLFNCTYPRTCVVAGRLAENCAVNCCNAIT